MLTSKKHCGQLNSYAAGVFGIFGLENNYLHVQVDKTTLILTVVILVIIIVFFIIHKIANKRLYKTISAKVKNN